MVAVQCDSISTTPSSPGLSQRQRTGVSALHKPILRALHQSTIVHGENALILRWEWRSGRGPFDFAQGRLFDYVAASLRDAATPLRMTFFCSLCRAGGIPPLAQNASERATRLPRIKVKGRGRGRPRYTTQLLEIVIAYLPEGLRLNYLRPSLRDRTGCPRDWVGHPPFPRGLKPIRTEQPAQR